MIIGQQLKCDYTTAKHLGEAVLSNTWLRIEAYGIDWVVFRDEGGEAQAISYPSRQDLEQMMGRLRENSL